MMMVLPIVVLDQKKIEQIEERVESKKQGCESEIDPRIKSMRQELK